MTARQEICLAVDSAIALSHDVVVAPSNMAIAIDALIAEAIQWGSCYGWRQNSSRECEVWAGGDGTSAAWRVRVVAR
jgi:hypothetical protein